MSTGERSELASDKTWFDAAISGRRVSADGGAEFKDAAHGGNYAVASRESFEGRLTGWRLDQGDPPWRWMEIGNLVDKPVAFESETVWCEESYIYFLDE